MGQTLDVASKQLFSRPDDECYPDIPSLIESLRARESVTQEVHVHDIKALPVQSGDTTTLGLELHGPEGEITATPTDWAFRSFCSHVKAPANYINRMEPERAAANLNADIATHFTKGNGTVAPVSGDKVRAFYSESYERVPDLIVAERVNEVCQRFGYEPAGRFAGKHVGMPPIRPEASGIYGGGKGEGRDIFLFVLNDERFFEFEDDIYYHCGVIWNSEVTWKKLGWISCLTRGVCGNHLIWDADEILTSEAIHKAGHNPFECLDKFDRLMALYDQRAAMQINHAKARLVASQHTEFADTRENVEKRLARYMTQKQASAVLPFLEDQRAYPKAPHSAFGIAQGVTLWSQTTDNASTRFDADRVAGKIIADVVGF
jgi:hypothetical protein